MAETHIQTHDESTWSYTNTHAGVCTCERILSAGPSFSPMVLSRCSSVSSGNVSPSMACSRNTWRRHSRFSHSPDINTHTHSTHKPTHSFTQSTKQWLYSKMLHIHFERKSWKLPLTVFTICRQKMLPVRVINNISAFSNCRFIQHPHSHI